jgi:hypothetical protein
MPESDSIVVWTTSEVEYETQDDESGDGEYLLYNAVNMGCPCQKPCSDLDRGKPEFTLAIYLGSE